MQTESSSITTIKKKKSGAFLRIRDQASRNNVTKDLAIKIQP